jgi:hypothetical protein
MKGFKPLRGRKLSLLHFFFPFFFTLFCISGAQAKTVVIGTGFGFISVPNMNGLNPGDVLAINPGTYSGGAFNNLKGITITNNGGTVVFTKQVTLVSLVECVFAGFQFINVQGISIRWDGNSRRCVERNIYFQDCTGSANDAQDHNTYTGDTSSLKFYMCTFDSLTLFRSGMVLMGSWGDAAAQICYMDSVVFSRIKVDSTLSNGTEVRGVFFHMDAHDWKVTYKGTNTISGDVGIFYIVGSGSFHHIYRIGGRGYIMRIWNAGLKSVGNTYFYDNIDLNSVVYGSIDTRVDPTQFTQYVTGGNCYIFNNTAGNKGDNIGYWASIAVVGTYALPYVCQVRNNLGFNINSRAKPPIAANQSSNTWISDTANNLYFDKPDGVVDPITGVPVANSPVLGKGLTLPLVKDDIYHNPRSGAYDIGAVQHGGAIIQPPPNQPPVAIADPAQVVNVPVTNIRLDGSKSYDPDGSISSYSWSVVSGSGAVISSVNSSSTLVSGLTQGVFVFKLTITDNNNASASVLDTVQVNAAGNLPPVANAGADQTILLPSTSTTLDGSASRDQDNGGILAAYLWSQRSGPSAAIISSADSASTNISGLQAGTYVFNLMVTDSAGATAKDSVSIVVKNAVNLAPIANAGQSKTITLPLDSVTLDGSGSSDPDGTLASFNWTQVSGPTAAVLASTSSAVTGAGSLVAGQYIFELTVIDNAGAVSKSQIKITVASSGLQPPVANAGANQTIQLPVNQVNLDGSSSVAPSGNITGYSWSQVSGPSIAAFGSANSAQSSAGNLIAGTYTFQLTIQDNNNVNASDSVVITVRPQANIPPVARAGAGITVILPANTAVLNGSQSTDADGTIALYNWTKISGPNTPGSSGDNTSVLSLSGLVAGQYNYQLTVTDNNGATGYAQVKINVVAPPNVLPVASAGPDQTITAPTSSVNLNGTASYDPDGSITGYTWVMVSGQGSVTISNGNTGTPAVLGLNPGVYVFRLTVTDNSGATAADQVTITVNPEPTLPNQAPIANAGNNQLITAPENSIMLNGSSSFDPDGAIVFYGWNQVSGPSTAGIANLNTATPTLSGLVVGTYVFQLLVTDNSGASNADQVTIRVNPAVNKINQSPVAMAGSDTTIYLPAAGIILNATNSYDPDGNIASYQWEEISGPNAAVASTFNGSMVDISDLQEGIYQFQVTVTDNQGASSTAIVKISVDKGAGSLDQFTVFPNPVHDMLNGRITSPLTGTVRMIVYDMNGRTVLKAESEKSLDLFEKTLNVSGLASGMYTIQVNIANRKTMITKFIKQ